MKTNLPINCPACGAYLRVQRCACSNCRTEVEGEFELPLLARLTPDEQGYLVNLIKCGGSLKDLARLYNVSYPTVRNRLDAVVARLNELKQKEREEETQDE